MKWWKSGTHTVFVLTEIKQAQVDDQLSCTIFHICMGHKTIYAELQTSRLLFARVNALRKPIFHVMKQYLSCVVSLWKKLIMKFMQNKIQMKKYSCTFFWEMQYDCSYRFTYMYFAQYKSNIVYHKRVLAIDIQNKMEKKNLFDK